MVDRVVATDRALACTFAELTALDPYVGARSSDHENDGGWTASEAPSRLRDALERIGIAWRTDDPRVRAAFFVNDYAWRLVAPAIGSFLLARRVPDLDREHVVMTANADGSFAAPLFRSTSYAGSAGDLGAAPVLTGGELVRLLRERIEDHFRPLVASVRRVAPLSRTGPVGSVEDVCGSAFLHAGKAIGRSEQARRWGERFLALDGEPLRTKQRFFVLRHGRRSETFMVRGSCCLVYKVGGHGYCATCPFTSDAERERRLGDWMAS